MLYCITFGSVCFIAVHCARTDLLRSVATLVCGAIRTSALLHCCSSCSSVVLLCGSLSCCSWALYCAALGVSVVLLCGFLLYCSVAALLHNSQWICSPPYYHLLLTLHTTYYCFLNLLYCSVALCCAALGLSVVLLCGSLLYCFVALCCAALSLHYHTTHSESAHHYVIISSSHHTQRHATS